jgi:hypothetical protein
MRLDRSDEILIYIEIGYQSARKRGLESRSVVQAFEHSLRPLRETFSSSLSWRRISRRDSFLPVHAQLRRALSPCSQQVAGAVAAFPRSEQRPGGDRVVLQILSRRSRMATRLIRVRATSMFELQYLNRVDFPVVSRRIQDRNLLS